MLEISSFYTCVPKIIIIWCAIPEIWSDIDIIFVLLGHLLPFYPSNDPENQSFEKMKKMPVDIIILDMCTINDDHMMYGSWDMECDRQNFLSCPFTPEQPVKSKFWKNGKKIPWRYYPFTHVYHKWWSCDVWFLRDGVRQAEFFVI